MIRLFLITILIILYIQLSDGMGTCICGNPDNAWNDTCPNWKVCDAYCFTRGGKRFWSGPDTWD
jgi:hypothetical protein